jgi:hypothetical protein
VLKVLQGRKDLTGYPVVDVIVLHEGHIFVTGLDPTKRIRIE